MKKGNSLAMKGYLKETPSQAWESLKYKFLKDGKILVSTSMQLPFALLLAIAGGRAAARLLQGIALWPDLLCLSIYICFYDFFMCKMIVTKSKLSRN